MNNKVVDCGRYVYSTTRIYNAFEGCITSIYSLLFYGGRNRFKTCIQAYLNGDRIGFSTHLSVFFMLMRGEYNPILKWPFKSKVSLVLLDQNMRQHIVQTFILKLESSLFHRPRLDMNLGSGCPHFAKLSVLDEGNYVTNNVVALTVPKLFTPETISPI